MDVESGDSGHGQLPSYDPNQIREEDIPRMKIPLSVTHLSQDQYLRFLQSWRIKKQRKEQITIVKKDPTLLRDIK